MADEIDPKAHPESVVEEIRSSAIDPQELHKMVDQAIQQRTAWVEKLTTLHKKRFGIRNKKKTFPFPGASALHLPLIDKMIRRIKPRLVNTVMRANPIAAFEPDEGQAPDYERQRLAEQDFHWLVHNRVPEFFRHLVIGMDAKKECGFTIFKQVYRHETRDVEEVFRLSDMSAEEVAATQQMADIDPTTGQPIVDPTTGQPQIRPMTDGELEGFFAERGKFDLTDDEDKDIVRQIIRGFKQSKKEVRFKRREVVHSAPMMVAVDPRDIIVPEDTTDVESARFIAYRFYLSENDLKIRERDGLYTDVERVTEFKVNQNADREKGTFIQTKQNREGVQEDIDESLIELWEVCCYADFNGDGVEERAIVTMHPDTHAILRQIPLPYDHGMWPYVKIDDEITDGRWYSPRGTAERQEDHQTEITAQHNAKIDRMTIQNAPTFKGRRGSILNASNMKWIPGQIYWMNSPDDLQPMAMPVLDSSFQIEENIIRQWAEESEGTTDFGLANPLSVRSEARTATEISQIGQIGEDTLSLEVAILQDGMAKVYHQLWSLWNQYGPDDVKIRIGEAERLVTRSDVQGKWRIRPTGDLINTNMAFQVQKAGLRLQLFNGDPFIRQDQLRRDYLEKDDFRLSQRLMKTPEELQAEAEAAQQAAEGPITLGQLAQGARQAAKQNGNRQVVMQ